MAGVFLNYRRRDTSGYAGRIFDRLVTVFGKQQIFRDVDRIEPGLDFTEVIDQSLESCAAMLVLIGPKWIELKGESGDLRLHEPVDYVRYEIEQALQRGLRVIPVLVPSVHDVPTEQQLPQSIAKLSKLHVFRLTEESWDAELIELSELLTKIGLSPIKPPPPPPGKRGIGSSILMGFGALFIAAMGYGLMFPESLEDQPSDIPGGLRLAEQSQQQPQVAVATASPSSTLGNDAVQVASSVSSAPSIPALADTWYDNYFNRYELSQSGNRVSAEAFLPTGEHAGAFTGTISGKQIDYTYTLVDGTTGRGTGTVQADNRHIDTVTVAFDSGSRESDRLHRGHLPH